MVCVCARQEKRGIPEVVASLLPRDRVLEASGTGKKPETRSAQREGALYNGGTRRGGEVRQGHMGNLGLNMNCSCPGWNATMNQDHPQVREP